MASPCCLSPLHHLYNLGIATDFQRALTSAVCLSDRGSGSEWRLWEWDGLQIIGIRGIRPVRVVSPDDLESEEWVEKLELSLSQMEVMCFSKSYTGLTPLAS